MSILVVVSDPCSVGRRRFPRVRRFSLLREAERYAARANRYQLGAIIQPVQGAR